MNSKSILSALLFIIVGSFCLVACNIDNEKTTQINHVVSDVIKDTINLEIKRGIIKTRIMNQSGEYGNYTLGDTFDIEVSFNEELESIIHRCELNIIPRSKEDTNCFSIRKVSNSKFELFVSSKCDLDFLNYTFKLNSDNLLFKVGNEYHDNIVLVTQINKLIHE